MEFGPSTVTVLLNQNHFQYCVLPYIFSLILLIIVYCIINFIRCLIVMLIWADNSKIKILSYLMQKEWFILLRLSIPKSYRTQTSDIYFFLFWTLYLSIFVAKFILFKMTSQQNILNCQKKNNNSMVNKTSIIVSRKKPYITASHLIEVTNSIIYGLTVLNLCTEFNI